MRRLTENELMVYKLWITCEKCPVPLKVTVVLASRTYIKSWWLRYSHCPLDLKHDSWLCFPTFLYLLELGLDLLFWFVCSYFQLPLFTHFREKKMMEKFHGCLYQFSLLMQESDKNASVYLLYSFNMPKRCLRPAPAMSFHMQNVQ